MPEIKSQPMPGLCAYCCAAVVTAEEYAVQMPDGTYHELAPGEPYQRGVLQDMASGEWQVHYVKVTDGGVEQELPMAAVAFVRGTAACALHLVAALAVTIE